MNETVYGVRLAGDVAIIVIGSMNETEAFVRDRIQGLACLDQHASKFWESRSHLMILPDRSQRLADVTKRLVKLDDGWGWARSGGLG